MTRPKPKKVLQVGRWQLLHDKNGWTIKNDNGDTRWPSSLASALQCIYESVIADNRFADETQDDLKALRDAIISANDAFESLLTSQKVNEIAEILRGERP